MLTSSLFKTLILHEKQVLEENVEINSVGERWIEYLHSEGTAADRVYGSVCVCLYVLCIFPIFSSPDHLH